ncbi:hypothetical protein MnTg02_00594 [bacterium MnTg02]|nr:hypothetical protein MnTg02_00594 [bacterium MnTg02]
MSVLQRDEEFLRRSEDEEPSDGAGIASKRPLVCLTSAPMGLIEAFA